MNTPKKPLDLYELSWPIFVEMTLMLGIGTIVLWMAGQISAAALGIFGLSLQFRFFFDRIFRVISAGTSVVISQHRGAGDIPGAQALAKAGFTASLWMGLGAFLIVGASPGTLLRLLQLPENLMPMAVPFMGMVAIALALEAINVTMFSVLRAFTFTKDSMRLVMAMNVFHMLVSVPLVFGVGSMPSQGLLGLGYALVISRGSVFCLLVWMWGRRLGIKLQFADAVKVSREAMRDILRIGLPGAGEKITYRICFMITVAMAASMGEVALAVHTYAAHITLLVGIVASSFSIGAEIIIGHHVGAAKLRKANEVLWRSLKICLIATGIASIGAWLFAPRLISLFSDNPTVPVLLSTILFIELLAGTGRTLTVIATSGLRAAGDVQFSMKVSILVNIVMGTGVAWLLGVHWAWGLMGLWLGYTLDECLRGIIMFLRWRYLGWIPKARATRRRIVAKNRLRAAATVATS